MDKQNRPAGIRKTIQKPFQVECFYTPPLGNKCTKIIEIKYNRSCGDYVQKNHWSYWTEREEDRENYICDDCLISLYKNDKYTFWEKVTSEKKRNILRTYVNSNILKSKRKIISCDNSGCETSCCYGCKCCEEKSKKIKELTKKFDKKFKSYNYSLNYKKRKTSKYGE